MPLRTTPIISLTELRKYERIAEEGIRDFFFFNHVIRGWLRRGMRTETSAGVYFGSMYRRRTHTELMRLIQDHLNGIIEEYVMGLTPRDTFKTDILIGAGLYALACDPNIPMGYMTKTEQKSCSRVLQMEWELERNDLYRKCYGDHFQNARASGRQWGKQGFLSAKRDQPGHDITMRAWGLESDWVGSHPRVLFIDDPVDDENQGTPDMRDKVTERLSLLNPLLRDGAKMVVIGTHWHLDDQYMRWEQSGLFKVLKFGAYIRPGDEEGPLFFPEYLTEKKLQKERIALGTYLFSCQFLNCPKESEERRFLPGWFEHTYDREAELAKEKTGEPSLLKDLWNYTVVDPAGEATRQSDEACVRTWGVAPNDQNYLLDCCEDKLGQLDLLNEILDQAFRWNVLIIGIEKGGFNTFVKPGLELLMRQRGRFFPIIEVSHQSKDKASRAKALLPFWESGKMVLPKTLTRRIWTGQLLDMTQKTIKDYLQFPNGASWHIIDTDAYFLKVRVSRREKSAQEAEPTDSLSPDQRVLARAARENIRRVSKQKKHPGDEISDPVELIRSGPHFVTMSSFGGEEDW